MSQPNPRPSGLGEQINERGAEFADKVRELFQEGAARNIVVTRQGKTVVQFPLLAGLIVAVLVPWLAAIGIVAALVTESTIQVTRTPPSPPTAGRSS